MRASVRRLEQTYHDRIDFHILNIDRGSTRDLAFRYEVAAIPTIVLLDADGRLVESFIGFRTEEELVAAVERLLAAGE